MEISRKKLDAVLIAHHRIDPDKQETFRSRVKTLQRMGFPPGTNVGRGPKMQYSAEHLLMLVSVFELQQIGLPAERAITTVLAGWRGLKTGFGVAFQLQDQFSPSNEQILGWVQGRALREMQFDLGPMYRDGSPTILPITASELTRMIQRSSTDKRMAYSYLALDLSDIVRSVFEAASNAAGLDDTDFGLELHRWADADSAVILGDHPLKEETDVFDTEA